MARILAVTDSVSEVVTDTSRGYTHYKRPVTEVHIVLVLNTNEAMLVARSGHNPAQLKEIFGPAKSYELYSQGGSTRLRIIHSTEDNPFKQVNTALIAEFTRGKINGVLSDLSSQQ